MSVVKKMLMRRTLYTLCLLFAVLLQVGARTPMRQWLTSMPDSVMPLLTQNNRLDFIDFFDARMEAVVTNLMDGKSCMDTLTDDYVRISYTQSCEVAMKLLPVNDSTDVLCMVTTAKAAIDDSRIDFFDEQWNPLPTVSYIAEPCMDDFRSIEQGDTEWGMLNIFFRTYHLSADSAELQCVFTATGYLSEEDRAAVAPYVRQEPITYGWINNRYQRYE